MTECTLRLRPVFYDESFHCGELSVAADQNQLVCLRNRRYPDVVGRDGLSFTP